MSLKVDYSETMNTIINGLTHYHNKKEIIGKMLIKGNLSLQELENKEELEETIRMSVEQTAYQILFQLKKQLGNNIEIFEEGHEIMTDL